MKVVTVTLLSVLGCIGLNKSSAAASLGHVDGQLSEVAQERYNDTLDVSVLCTKKPDEKTNVYTDNEYNNTQNMRNNSSPEERMERFYRDYSRDITSWD